MGIDTQKSWLSESVAATYARSQTLMPAELAVFAHAYRWIEDGRVLDLGVGAGRTLPYLAGPSKKYVAIDYSEAMVALCRRSHPTADVRLGDARALDGFDAGSFDFVYFSYNSIDCVPLEGRNQVFDEVLRVLRPGGAFGFSSHNARTLANVPAKLHMPEVEWTLNPAKLAVRLARAGMEAGKTWQNQLRLRKGEVRGDGYAVVNDGAHEASMLFVYADPAWQCEELLAHGFTAATVFDERGRRVKVEDANDPWIHYLTEKPG